MTRLLIVLAVWISCATLAQGEEPKRDKQHEIPRALFNYVERDEQVFAWKLKSQQEVSEGVIYDVDLTSQKWQGITWKHALTVCEPKKIQHPNHVLLFVTGGSNGNRPSLRDMRRGLALAELCGARVATIHQVPNQPLFDGRKEDDLITETWLKYLDTGDENWPLLFPMVKSAVRAMDALEELAASEWKEPINGFAITGASKRGWTSWLAAVADDRIVATAPMVIDVLNFRPQMKHQLDAWGKYSEQIIDYTSKGLIKEGDETPRDTNLRRMMDPYTYRKQLEVPKLLINGTNDRYWVADAMSLYWDDLVGSKNVLQIPNAGHGLDGGHALTLSTIAAFFQHAATKTAMPTLKWEHFNSGDDFSLAVTSTVRPSTANLWVAHSETRDFRDSRWNSHLLDVTANTVVGSLTKPQQGHIAYYCELKFDAQGIPYSLCTVIRCE